MTLACVAAPPRVRDRLRDDPRRAGGRDPPRGRTRCTSTSVAGASASSRRRRSGSLCPALGAQRPAIDSLSGFVPGGAISAYLEGGTLHVGGRPLPIGRLEATYVPRLDTGVVFGTEAHSVTVQATPPATVAEFAAAHLPGGRIDADAAARPDRSRRGAHAAGRRRARRLARPPPGRRRPDRRRRRRRPHARVTHHAALRDAARLRHPRRGAARVRRLGARARHDRTPRRAAAPSRRSAARPAPDCSTAAGSPSPSCSLTSEGGRMTEPTDRPRRAPPRRVRRLRGAAPGQPRRPARARRRDRPGRDGDPAQRRGPRRDGLRRPGRRHHQRHGRRDPARAGRRPRAGARGRRGGAGSGPVLRRGPRGRAAAYDRDRPPRRPRDRAGVGPRRERVRRGHGRARRRLRRDGLQRQRPGRAGGRAQADRGRPRAAGDGARLRHRRRRRGRPRASPTPPDPGRSASSPPPAPAASSCSRCSTTPASASARRWASAAATSPPRSAGSPRWRRCAGSTPTTTVELIVVVSKPPAPEVATRIEEYAATLATPVELALLGAGRPDLTAAAEAVLARLGTETPAWPVDGHAEPGGGGSIRGLFVGGTLCQEAASSPGTERRATRSSTSATTPTPRDARTR